MKVLSVVGARPQFVKLSAVVRDFGENGVDHIIVHTGQHYDPMLSDVFFSDLQIPDPDEHLGVGSAGHGKQTGDMLTLLDDVLPRHRPDWVLVFGDTNTTLAGALSAVKLHFPVAHVEAGLRSFNRRMPEEHNRVLTDHAADLCLAPTEVAMTHLADEGLAGRSVLVGDVMADVLLYVRDTLVPARPPLSILGSGIADEDYLVATLHRAENTDDPERLKEIVDSLASIGRPVLLLAHPRLVKRASDFGIPLDGGQVRVSPPLAFPDLVACVMGSAGVVTDSGGLQKEAFLLRIPCTTVREETEWTETVDLGWNVLANTRDEIVAAANRPRPEDTTAMPYGSGDAAARVREALVDRLTQSPVKGLPQ